MWIIPAIDLRGGQVVRLTQGEFDKETIYSAAPEAVVGKWQSAGAELLHVVDLDGALHGHRKNLGSLKNILRVSRIPVELGGGLRTHEAVEEVLQAGVWRAVIGTKAFDLDFINKLSNAYPDRIVVGIDVRDGVIQTHGWKSGETRFTLETFVKELQKTKIKSIICTDISRDGMMQGPNFDLLNRMLEMTTLDIILSGGVSELEHLEKLSTVQANHFRGVIIGKALYEGKIDLREAIKKFQR